MNRKTILTVLLILSCCLGLTFEFGFNYGSSNQNTYLLSGLRLYDSSLLANDWLASECTDFHPVFAYLAWLLFVITPGGWSFAIANFISISISCILIWLILGNFVNENRKPVAFVLVIALVAANETTSVSGSYLMSGIFQPSTLGSLGLLGSIYFFSKRRFWMTGLSIAAGGVFHINYLILSVPLVITAHLIVEKRLHVRSLIENLAPPILALVPFIPLIWSAVGATGSEQARWIFQQFRAPHHYLPNTYLTEFIPFIGWNVLAYVGSRQLLNRSESTRMLRGVWIASLGLIFAASVLTTIVFIPVVAQLYIWRLAPYSVLFAQILVVAGSLELVFKESRLTINKVTPSSMFFALLSIYGIYAFSTGWHIKLTLGILVILLVSVLLNFHFHNRTNLQFRIRYRSLIPIVAIVFGLSAIVHTARDFRHRSILLYGLPPGMGELVEWAKNTPVESEFLIPPNLELFRLHAQRAVIVDFKSHPILPDELLEWYQRLKIISGVDSLTNRHQAAQGYDQSVIERLDSIDVKYAFDYAIINVLNNSKPLAPSGYAIAYKNNDFVVLERLNAERR